MAQLDLINVVILIGAGLIVLSALTSLLSARLGVPLLLVFLAVGLLAGVDGPGGIAFDNAPLAFFVGSAALAVILFDAGFETTWRSYRLAAGPGLMLATVGVVVTASLVAVAAQWVLPIDWTTAFLLGAIVASTDAAAVFLLLRMGGFNVRDRVRSTLEIESGSNDPIAIFLTLGLAQLAVNPDLESIFALLPTFLLQLGLGALGGFAGGRLIVWLVNRVRLEEGLYPVVVVGLALAIFGALNALGASGFLGVYVAGLVAGNSRLYNGPAIRRFQVGLTWLCQIGMFLALGLLATPSRFLDVLWQAVVIGCVLILLARPLAAWASLLPFRFGRRETAFIGWVGLRGAVSILLAIVPLMTGHPDGTGLFNVALVVVILSLVVQGWSVRPMARLLGQIVPTRKGPVDRVELALPGERAVEMVVYTVHPESPVARGQHLPRWARPALVLRQGAELQPEAATTLLAGDHLYLFATPDKVPLLDRLFAGQVELSPEDREFFGDFALPADMPLSRLASEYGLPVPPDAAGLPLAAYFQESFGAVEVGDRLRLATVELVVTEVEGAEARQIGLVLDPPLPKRPLPFLPTGAEIKAMVAALLRRLGERRAAGGQAARPRREPALLPGVPSPSGGDAAPADPALPLAGDAAASDKKPDAADRTPAA